jgi:hypothetical protein
MDRCRNAAWEVGKGLSLTRSGENQKSEDSGSGERGERSGEAGSSESEGERSSTSKALCAHEGKGLGSEGRGMPRLCALPSRG